jgi:serine/threonine protein kinase
MAAKKPDDDKIVGDWQAIHQIARGGMGVAFKARNLQNNQVAVLKFLLPREKEKDPKKLQAEFKRFKNEKETLEKFNSKYISKFYDADLDYNPPWIAMQYFAGITVWDEIEDNGPIEEHKWWELAHDLLSGLVYIHDAKGRVHRDLNPKNVMLVFGGARLIDFGIARLEGSDSSATHAYGFPGYTSPEHYTEAAHPKNDVFVAATVLTFAATGKIPWKADTSGQYLGSIFKDAPNYRGLNEKQQKLLKAMHQKNPSDRLTSAKALALLESLTKSMPEKKTAPSKAIKEVKKVYQAPSIPRKRVDDLGLKEFWQENKGLFFLAFFTGGWGLFFYWLWRRKKKLPPIEKPILFKVIVSALLSLVGYGSTLFIPTFYWSKKLADRKLFRTAIGACFLTPFSLMAIGAETPEGETSGWVVFYAGFILFLIYRVHRRVYRILSEGSIPDEPSKRAEKKARKKATEEKAEQAAEEEVEEVVETPEVKVSTDSNFTTGEVSWEEVENTIFQYLASRKGKQFNVEIISNEYTGIYFQGYSEPGGYITVEAASNISVQPPLQIENRKGLIKIGWEPPSDGLPNFIKFLDLKESENSEIAKLFVETLQSGYLLKLGSFKIEV